MADRKKTPNILGDLLGGAPVPTSTPTSETAEVPTAVKPESRDTVLPAKNRTAKTTKPEAVQTAKSVAVKTANPKDRKTLDQDAVLPANQRTVRPVISETSDQGEGKDESEEAENGAKVKVTFYLSEDAVESLEDGQRRLRKLNRTEGRRKSKSATSKSAILEEAVRLVCTELQEQGIDSQLAKVLL